MLVVSTDDEEYSMLQLNMAPCYSATWCFKLVTLHPQSGHYYMRQGFEEERQFFDYIIVLEPTSPIPSPQGNYYCIEKISTSDGDSLMTVIEDTIGDIGRVEDRYISSNCPWPAAERHGRIVFHVL